MKICCIGTHGVGKSTLVYQLADQYKRAGKNVYVVQEVVRACPYPINDSMMPETAIWTVCEQIKQELTAQKHGYDVIVCDRSAFDPMVYANKLMESPLESFLKDLRQTALEWLQTYDRIFWVRPDMDIKEDGVRSTDIDFQQEIDQLFTQIHDEIKDYTTVVWTSEIMQKMGHPRSKQLAAQH